MPMEYWIWKIAFETGWTLEYIERLSIKRYHEYQNIVDGIAKARGK